VTARPAATSELTLGDDMRITFVADGSIHIPSAPMYENGTPEIFTDNPHLLDDEGFLLMSLGAVLVETAGQRVLVDLGIGPAEVDLAPLTGGPGRMTGGDLLKNLARRGVQPEAIDLILFTHLHADHVGWLTTETPAGPALTFPRAGYFLVESEWSFWSDPSNVGRPGGPTQAQRDALEGRMSFLADGSSPVPGISPMFTPGHTPGHCSFVLSSGAHRALVLGDTIHCPLEISHPELALLSDVDPAAGKSSRTRLQRELDAPNTVAIGTHFPDTVFARVTTGATGRYVTPLT
jgi:glyoxylase-like metal-dependent hydrolase (beta-lactamase superfamily II)